MVEDMGGLLGLGVHLEALPAEIPAGCTDQYVLFRNGDGLFFGHEPMGLPISAKLSGLEFRDGKAFVRAAYFADPYSQTPSGYLYVTLIPADNRFGFSIEYIETRTE